MINHPLFFSIERALDSIRPYLVADGGNVEIVEITKDNAVKLSFVGNCSTCSMAAMTFRNGIEETIRREVPEVSTIESI